MGSNHRPWSSAAGLPVRSGLAPPIPGFQPYSTLLTIENNRQTVWLIKYVKFEWQAHECERCYARVPRNALIECYIDFYYSVFKFNSCLYNLPILVVAVHSPSKKNKTTSNQSDLCDKHRKSECDATFLMGDLNQTLFDSVCLGWQMFACNYVQSNRETGSGISLCGKCDRIINIRLVFFAFEELKVIDKIGESSLINIGSSGGVNVAPTDYIPLSVVLKIEGSRL